MADEDLIGGWREWAGEHGLDEAELADAEATLQLLLQLRRAAVDDRLTSWTAASLYELLFGLFPAPFQLEEDEATIVTSHVASFMQFLDDTGRLGDDSDELSRLLFALDDIADQLCEVDDPDVPSRRRISLPPDAVIPAARLAPHDELEAAALTSTPFVRLCAFVDWVGEGRKLTRTGNLTVADGLALVDVLGTDDLGPDRSRRVRSSTDLNTVDATYLWASVAGLVEIERGRVVPTPESATLANDRLAWFLTAFDALVAIGVLERGWTPPWTRIIETNAVDMLVLAYLQGTLPRSEVHGLARSASEVLASDELVRGLGGLETIAGMVDRDVDDVIERLRDLALVTSDGGATTGDDDAGDDDGGDGGDLRLTPLGAWVTNQLLLADGYEAPAFRDLEMADALSLLRACGVLSAEQMDEELGRWRAARTVDAVDELAAAVRDAGPGEIEILPPFFAALRHFDQDAEAQVRRLLDDPRVRPYATAWLIDKELEKLDALDDLDVPALLLDQLAATLVATGPEGVADALAELGNHEAQLRVIELVWRIDGPYTSAVLIGIADAHPSKVVAKAARKALFRRHSAGYA